MGRGHSKWEQFFISLWTCLAHTNLRYVYVYAVTRHNPPVGCTPKEKLTNAPVRCQSKFVVHMYKVRVKNAGSFRRVLQVHCSLEGLSWWCGEDISREAIPPVDIYAILHTLIHTLCLSKYATLPITLTADARSLQNLSRWNSKSVWIMPTVLTCAVITLCEH